MNSTRSVFNLETKDELIRLQRYLAMCGVASRRNSEILILDGRVGVNGSIVRILGTKVSMSDSVTCDGKRVRPEKRKVYIVLNKPRGYLCSLSDPEDRPLAIDLLFGKYNERLYNVGRLDFNTSGLIIFTNDGDFARDVSHPSSEIEKQYEVDSSEPIDEQILNNLKKGTLIDGIRYKIIDYKITGPHRVKITLVEGKNREIRKIYEANKLYVRKIHRTRIGPVRISNLKMAAHRDLTRPEIEWFRKKGGKTR
ncbi:MAG: rRNA pseudouridine synthase [Spirochaetales bacterium]|nr:rRNA pseudouridine synthase [Spirochaetales bacterium]